MVRSYIKIELTTILQPPFWESKPQPLKQLTQNSQDLVRDCQLSTFLSFHPCFQLMIKARESQICFLNQSHNILDFQLTCLQLTQVNILQSELNRSVLFFFFLYKVSSLPCLPLNLCQIQAMVIDFLAIESSINSLCTFSFRWPLFIPTKDNIKPQMSPCPSFSFICLKEQVGTDNSMKIIENSEKFRRFRKLQESKEKRFLKVTGDQQYAFSQKG